MGFWSRILGPPAQGEPNENGPADINFGDPNGLDLSAFDNVPEARALPWIQPSAWSGYPEGWNTPAFNVQQGMNKLIDIAWACLDLNTRVLATMPVYRMRNGRVIEPLSWMQNPDPTIYSSWQEFAKQLFWDYYATGEAFVLPMVRGTDGYPMRFRVIPPWLMNVEMRDGGREYRLGKVDVTDEVLHIRYSSSTDNARGVGPLAAAGARMTQIGVLQKYASTLAETGGTPMYWLGVDRRMNPQEGKDLLDTWIESRTKYAGHPAIVGSGATLNQAKSMNAKDMALLEISQFSESRIAILTGVPPFLVGLAGATGSLTYSNIADLFDFHDRSSLRPAARMVMEGVGAWALPRGQDLELNSDDYTRLPLDKRAASYKILIEMGVLSAAEVREMERYTGAAWTQALTGAQVTDGPVDPPEQLPVPPAPAQPQRPPSTNGQTNGRPRTP